jgi:Zn-dependent protease/CBS domain-containing protein
MLSAPWQSMFLRGGIRLGKLFGIQIVLDWSLIVIFTLVVLSLGAGAFPAWHPDWSRALSFGVALAAAALFFVSILLHELSHALVAKAFKIPVGRITLFLFGGIANIEQDPDSPKKEALIAAVGPATSITLGVVFTLLAAVLVRAGAGPDADPALIVRQMGPVTTLLAWLGPVNILLGIFNLLPGFPLDGGRVLRATLWGLTGSLHKATRWAAGVGQAFGWLLVMLGVAMAFGFWIPVLGGGLVNGLWLALIGWFLATAARSAYQQLLVREALEGVPVSRIMRRELPPPVPATATVSAFVDEVAMQGDHSLYPVIDASGSLEGFVRVSAVRDLPRSQWADRPVRELAKPVSQLTTARPDEAAYEALGRMGRHDDDTIVVVDNERVVGLVSSKDVARWLSLGGVDAQGPGLGTLARSR